MKKVSELMQLIESQPDKSAWSKGVKLYAYELLENVAENNGGDYEFCGSPADKKELLNGASDWSQYSWGGCSSIYNEDIAKRLCSPSEFKKSKNGENLPNNREQWLDTQARALTQAEALINRLSK